MITQAILVCWNADPLLLLQASPPDVQDARCHDCQSDLQARNADLEVAKATEREIGRPITPLCVHCTVQRHRLLGEGEHIAMLGPSRAVAKVNQLTGARP